MSPPRQKDTMKLKEKRADVARSKTPTKDDILKFIRSSTGNIGRREIARAFDIKGSDRIDLKRILKELAADGLIADTRRLVKKEALANVAVIVVKTQDREGDLICAPLNWNEDEDGAPPRILLNVTRRYEGAAIGVGDHVLARIREAGRGAGADDADAEAAEDASGFAYLASPIKRLPRERARQLGILRKSGGGFVVESIDKKDLKEWPVADGEMDGAEEGELVRFETLRDSRTNRPSARVTERIGHPKAEKAVSLIAIHNHGLRDVFGEDVLVELERLPEATMSHREDLTRVPLITIDPFDAKDHDDAVWAAPDTDPANEGGTVVIVAIADVSFYIRPGSALDEEALLRGNSVYFPDRVVPMLPEKLSNGLCSLRENELRPCLAVRITFDRDGKKVAQRFSRAMMRSAAKLSYQEAQAAIDGNPNARTKPLLEPILKPLWAVYEVLKEARNRRAPLDLDLPERKIVLDDRGLVSKVIIPERLEAHRLIEEFMIQANVAAAEALEARKSPLIYRVHDAPSSEKLVALSEFLASIGVNAGKTSFNRPGQFNRVLTKAIGTEHEEILNEVVLRSQAQAEYRPGNIGHFGLNLRRYAHFTSPIRRYADLVVHRALVSAFGLGEGGLSDAEKTKLDAIAEAISQSERKAMSAERETVDRLIAMHLAERVGETFKARVSGVTRFGLFVKLLDTGADGFVPMATLGRDYYKHLENLHAIVGERTGESFRLGDRVDVKLVEANPAAGALRFDMVSDGKFSAALAKVGRKRGSGKPARAEGRKPGKGAKGRR
ncbi:ribonuclease R [Rhodomicrobium vannielii ATCC 17100]|nr:ribonuclease R [Rhodomicrobium vannielii ATCC 17100]